MRIHDDFIRDNHRIDILSNRGETHQVPASWQPLLGEYDALVVIPDMHMFYYGSPQDCFQYGARAMKSFLEHLVDVQTDYRARGLRLVVVQLGDMYEMRYPHPKTGLPVTLEAIASSHRLYRDILNLMRRLGTVFVIGNHDYELAEATGGEFSATFGRVYLEHGFQADRWYHFSNPECKLWRSMMFMYGIFRRWEARYIRMRHYFGTLRDGEHAAFGVLSGEEERGFPSDATAYSRRRLGYYDMRVRDHWREGQQIRVCVTAHSHTPLLYTHACHDHCWFVDAGAWTEGRSDFVVITNDEIAVCRYRRATVSVAVPVATPFLEPKAAVVGR